MSVLPLHIACCIVSILQLSVSDAKQAFACGNATKQCQMLHFECLPGGTIEITTAYAVLKDESLQCQKNVTDCSTTYRSNCCSEVKGNDSVITFSDSRFHTVKEHCDKRQTCSNLILTHTTGLQVVEYNCKTDYQTSTKTTSPTKAVSITLGVLCVCAFLLGGSATIFYCVKRHREKSLSQVEQREITYDYISDAPFVNTRGSHGYYLTPVDHGKDEDSVYNHLNEPEPRVEGHYDTTAPTLAYRLEQRSKDSDDRSQDEDETYNHVGAIQERIVVVDNTYNVVHVPMEESQCLG